MNTTSELRLNQETIAPVNGSSFIKMPYQEFKTYISDFTNSVPEIQESIRIELNKLNAVKDDICYQIDNAKHNATNMGHLINTRWLSTCYFKITLIKKDVRECQLRLTVLKRVLKDYKAYQNDKLKIAIKQFVGESGYNQIIKAAGEINR